MELSKLHDGFVVEDVLTIKAQIQVIREKADRPFRCLDGQYQKELIRVYLSNMEQICRRFIDERRSKLSRLIEDKQMWSRFNAFWLGMDPSVRWHMTREKTDTILKVLVKYFSIEKEVTSTLDGSSVEEFNKDSIERDDRRLIELGWKTLELFVLAHIFSRIEVAYQEAVALKRLEEFIREEVATGLAEIELKAKPSAAEKESAPRINRPEEQ